ncbi:hypothetical protein E5288_WYG005699 [Bos mutus]|uniref:Uncharacterized protein n=1 Tax=Bos mutus TaxID=72004 RepID=A0A6B0RUY7_9CETA|nr:hypothetical protein [Bos mutus]
MIRFVHCACSPHSAESKETDESYTDADPAVGDYCPRALKTVAGSREPVYPNNGKTEIDEEQSPSANLLTTHCEPSGNTSNEPTFSNVINLEESCSSRKTNVNSDSCDKTQCCWELLLVIWNGFFP